MLVSDALFLLQIEENTKCAWDDFSNIQTIILTDVNTSNQISNIDSKQIITPRNILQDSIGNIMIPQEDDNNLKVISTLSLVSQILFSQKWALIQSDMPVNISHTDMSHFKEIDEYKERNKLLRNITQN